MDISKLAKGARNIAICTLAGLQLMNMSVHLDDYFTARHQANRGVYSRNMQEAWELRRDYHLKAAFFPFEDKPYFDIDDKGNFKTIYH